MLRKTLAILVLLAVVVAGGCGPLGGPEAAAQTALDSWAKTTNTPYKDAAFQTLKNDGTFAAVRITVQLRQSAATDWQGYQCDIECRKVSNQWQAPGYLSCITSQQVAAQAAAVATQATAVAVQAQATATAATTQAQAAATARASILGTLSGHASDVNSVAFSPDGKTLASGSWDETVRLWDAASGQAVRTFSGHTWPVWSVAFSPDGKTLASGSWDTTVRLWRVK